MERGGSRGLWPLHPFLWHATSHPSGMLPRAVVVLWLHPVRSCSTSHPCCALQIEVLVMEMQNTDTGIKTQTQRVMITTIPHAVAGRSFAGGMDWAKEVDQRKAVCGPHGHPRVTTAWLHTGACVPNKYFLHIL